MPPVRGGHCTAPAYVLPRSRPPHIRRLFELCDKYKVPMFLEAMTVDAARARFRDVLGLKETEPFWRGAARRVTANKRQKRKAHLRVTSPLGHWMRLNFK
jgi:hypothetical protein